MIYLISKKSIVTTGETKLVAGVAQRHGLSVSDWLMIDRATGCIRIDGRVITQLIRRPECRKVFKFICNELLSYKSVYQGESKLKIALRDYDTLMALIKEETKGKTIDEYGNIEIGINRDIPVTTDWGEEFALNYNVTITIANAIYFKSSKSL